MYRNKVLVSPEKYYVPKIIEKLSSKELLVSEFVSGTEIDTFA